nr:uncharacterized protein LOC112696217 [Arachis hypogaea]
MIGMPWRKKDTRGGYPAYVVHRIYMMNLGSITYRRILVRRESTNVEDLFIAHIIGMDTMARGFKNAAKLIEESISQEKKRSHAGFVFKRLINTIVYFICCFLFYLVRSL